MSKETRFKETRLKVTQLKVTRPLMVGGAAVIGVVMFSSLLLASPGQVSGSTYSSLKLHTPAYIAQSNGSDKEKMLNSIGVDGQKLSQAQAATEATATPNTQPQDTKTQEPAKAPEPAKKPDPPKVTKPKTEVRVASASRGTSVSATSSAIANYALQYRGVPYVWGGTSSSGWDCSGFTTYVFKHFGINLPRTAQSQYSTGTAISKADLQPGDLVFFSTYTSGASHVGIYCGNGQFVHAANSEKGTITSSLSESYYSSRYLGARRMTN